MRSEKNVNFLGIVSLIGSILILLGVAWIVASNWHVISDILKIIILFIATSSSLIIGTVIKGKVGREFTGRSLLFLGGGFYVLSVFLISQIFFTHASEQGFVNLILLCWPALLLIAYFLDSKENIVFGLVVFGVWLLFQFMVLVDVEDSIFAMIILFIMIGILLYGLKQLHKIYNHRFYKLYSFWTSFYLLLGAFILTFQTVLSTGIIEGGMQGFTNPFFLAAGLGIVFFFIVSIVITLDKNPKDMKEVLIFVGIIFMILFSVFLVKISSNIDEDRELDGYCHNVRGDNYCSDKYEEEECSFNKRCAWSDSKRGVCSVNISMHDRLVEHCFDVKDTEVCYDISCHTLDEEKCRVMDDYGCYWKSYGKCEEVVEEKEILQECFNFDSMLSCEKHNECSWTVDKRRYDIDLNWFAYILWLAYNVFFIGLVVLMIGYGKKEGQREIINIAFLFFVLVIISRYIGFAMELVGYLGFSIVAITGGAVLISGAYLVQKYWKRELNEISGVKNG